MESVQVAVRIRPLLAGELTRGSKDVVSKTHNEPQMAVQSSNKTSLSYRFNNVFGQHETQEMVYSNSARPLVLKFLEGYNITILTYGQTGSGKTYTMGTLFDSDVDPDDVGLIPRAIRDVFGTMEGMPDHDFIVNCSFMELYQEQLKDLLSTKTQIVDIRETINKEIYIPNLTEVPVNTIEKATNCIIRGSAGSRSVGSHGIFTISIEMIKKKDPSSSTKSKLQFVDLAGSESFKKLKAAEGVKINQGLLALGNVLSALGAEKVQHIRYRDSKLTRLLQTALGGNSLTLLIACVSPADHNIEETTNTLRYADRVKQIKIKPIVNQDPEAAEINRMNETIQKLRLELLAKSEGTGQNPGNSAELHKLREELVKERQNSKGLTARLEEMLHEVVNMQYRLNESEEMADQLISKSKLIKEKCFELNDNITKDDCPVELIIQSSQINELKNLIVEMDALSNSKTIVEASFPASTYEQNLLNSPNTDTEMSQYVSKQIGVQGELKQMKTELQLKEELLHRYLDNLSSFETLKTDEANKNYEEIISKLEEEKEDLKNTLKVKTNNVSAKLAEERKKRVQVLEHQISEMKKKNLQQAQILKHREQQIGKIELLQKEIHEIKSQKVQLIRNMKSESERFRQRKLQRKKLKAKDRKLETEMERKELLHDKQKNILKRRVDESLRTIKRLKDTLEKGKNAKRPNQTNGGVDHIKGWMDEELEVILSVIDAKQSLEQLIEDRSVMNVQLNHYKKQFENTDADRTEMAQLQEDIEMRNAQISDLRDKIATSNVEKNVQTICEGLHSMPETKAAIKYLFDHICDSRTEYINTFTKLQDLHSMNELAETKRSNMDELQKQEIQKLVAHNHETEKDYEEKISVLLRQLNSTDDRNSEVEQIHEDVLENLFKKNELLQMKIKELMTELSKDARSAKKKKKKVVYHTINESDLVDSIINDMEEEKNEMTRDPDWRQSPERNPNRQARDGDGQTFCNCGTNCRTLRCKCRKTGSDCSEDCGCPADDCVNRSSASSSSVR